MDGDKLTFDVAGKAVTFKERLPMKDAAKFQGLLTALDTADLNTAIPALRLAIAKWELPGDPNNAGSYGELDIFTEMLPLVAALGEYAAYRAELSAKAQALVKNSARASS